MIIHIRTHYGKRHFAVLGNAILSKKSLKNACFVYEQMARNT